MPSEPKLSEYVRNQPDFFAVGPATTAGATDVGAGIWCSPGMSSSYLITTDDGRIVVNTGMWFEAKTHKRNYDAVDASPTRYIILTQSHTDHIGGVDTFREPATQLIAQQNIHACQADDVRIHGLRIRRSLPFFAAVMGQPEYVRGDDATIPPLAKAAEPDITFDDRYEVTCGGRTLELLSVPGGETIDSLVVWIPADGVALVGNMFSALFGHFPNLVTVRADRMRSAPAFVASVQRVIDLEPETLLLGHHGPVRGAALVRSECERIRDAVQYVHDATTTAMNDGLDVWTAMRTIALPDELSLGEAYGRVDWSVRAIWETYAGWFHQHSTLDLYGAPPEQGAAEIVALAGGADDVAARAGQLALTDPLSAVRLCELVLAEQPEHIGALRAYRRAHEQLLVEHNRANFWLTGWLEGEVRSATNRIERAEQA
ncbi:MAG TPA: alkyl sulfatase dimerization domain-containing protein [Acidimicrobiia bacterium]|nr:alkyl sulfatase dimerization domain-containing protein [Acidimicrobiia bacterium]